MRSSQRMTDQSVQRAHSLEATAILMQSLPSRLDCKEQRLKELDEESYLSDGGASDEASLERAAVEGENAVVTTCSAHCSCT